MSLGDIIGGVASVAGSVFGSSSNKKAAKNAAQASQYATDQAVGLQRDIYNQNNALLSPFVQRGNQAGNAINAMLGLGGAEMTTGGPATTSVMNPYQTGMDAAGRYGLSENGDLMFPAMGGPMNALAGFGGGMSQMQPSPQQAQNNAFDGFRGYINNSDYAFNLGEGLDALNSGFAGSGLVQSGAALRGALDYQDNLRARYRGEYLNLLGEQQGVGLGGASAVAGVGQNYANNAGQLIMNNADNQANAAIYRAQNNPLAVGLGTIGGGLFGYGRR
jgi:hypothetical protein